MNIVAKQARTRAAVRRFCPGVPSDLDSTFPVCAGRVGEGFTEEDGIHRRGRKRKETQDRPKRARWTVGVCPQHVQRALVMVQVLFWGTGSGQVAVAQRSDLRALSSPGSTAAVCPLRLVRPAKKTSRPSFAVSVVPACRKGCPAVRGESCHQAFVAQSAASSKRGVRSCLTMRGGDHQQGPQRSAFLGVMPVQVRWGSLALPRPLPPSPDRCLLPFALQSCCSL